MLTAGAGEALGLGPLLAQAAGEHGPVWGVRSREFYVLVQEEGEPPPVVAEGALQSCETGAPAASQVVGRIVGHREGYSATYPASRRVPQTEGTATAPAELSEGRGRCNGTTRLTIAAEERRTRVGDIQVVGGMMDEPRCTDPPAEADGRQAAGAGGGRQAGEEEESVQEHVRRFGRTARSRTAARQDKGTDKAADGAPLAGDTYIDLRTPSAGVDASCWAWAAGGCADQEPARLQGRERGRGMCRTSWRLRWNAES